MIISKKLTDKRITEIETFEDKTDIDFPELTPEVLSTVHSAHLENLENTLSKSLPNA